MQLADTAFIVLVAVPLGAASLCATAVLAKLLWEIWRYQNHV